ncbi:hypothetical protein FGO68_gene15366 [Halteria grandinella]|uniref:Protein kinase domain-containing protein n=1 Tax=Halteria grandinella TaxID=5974 RepID=A0A8J8NV72_HALGN|nr:hypothetical protein FGO68_gene15366 [Halteria grandinella]
MAGNVQSFHIEFHHESTCLFGKSIMNYILSLFKCYDSFDIIMEPLEKPPIKFTEVGFPHPYVMEMDKYFPKEIQCLELYEASVETSPCNRYLKCMRISMTKGSLVYHCKSEIEETDKIIKVFVSLGKVRDQYGNESVHLISLEKIAKLEYDIQSQLADTADGHSIAQKNPSFYQHVKPPFKAFSVTACAIVQNYEPLTSLKSVMIRIKRSRDKIEESNFVRKFLQLYIHIADQIAAIQCELKRVGIFHRDIKPENYLITEDLKVKLIDFGHATKDKDRNFNVGTPGYLSPEVSSLTQDYDLGKADMFSVGVTLYEMLVFCDVRLFDLETKDGKELNAMLSRGDIGYIELFQQIVTKLIQSEKIKKKTQKLRAKYLIQAIQHNPQDRCEPELLIESLNLFRAENNLKYITDENKDLRATVSKILEIQPPEPSLLHSKSYGSSADKSLSDDQIEALDDNLEITHFTYIECLTSDSRQAIIKMKEYSRWDDLKEVINELEEGFAGRIEVVKNKKQIIKFKITRDDAVYDVTLVAGEKEPFNLEEFKEGIEEEHYWVRSKMRNFDQLYLMVSSVECDGDAFALASEILQTKSLKEAEIQ